MYFRKAFQKFYYELLMLLRNVELPEIYYSLLNNIPFCTAFEYIMFHIKSHLVPFYHKQIMIRLYVRKIKFEDIYKIKEICKSLFGNNDHILCVIEEWIHSRNCLNYGVFKDEIRKDLISFGRVNFFSDKLAWFEGFRIKKFYQSRGIGKIMMRYGLDCVKQRNIKIAQCSISSTNFKSIAMVKSFNFKKKKELEKISLEIKRFKQGKPFFTHIETITPKEALEVYKSMKNGPKDELCVGGAFIPLKLENLLKENWIWFRNNGAILLKICEEKAFFNKGTSDGRLMIIGYGEPKAIIDLLQYIIQEELKSREIIKMIIFSNSKIKNEIIKIGLPYHKKNHHKYFLFEKKFK